MRHLTILFLAAGLTPALGQTPERPVFEVATIKPNLGCQPGRAPGGPTSGRLTLNCATLRNLIRAAYGGLDGNRVAARRLQSFGGPAWLDTDRFDISAKAEGNAPITQMLGPMLQALLEERFSLKLHREMRPTPIYALTVATRDPSKTPGLRPAAPGSCTPVDINQASQWERPNLQPGAPRPNYCGMGVTQGHAGKNTIDSNGTTLSEFAGRMLPVYFDRPLIDKTELTGTWDIHLEFAPEQRNAGPVLLNGVPTQLAPQSDPEGPTIETAIHQQLGLKLTPAKGQIEVIVVDSAEKPTAN